MGLCWYPIISWRMYLCSMSPACERFLCLYLHGSAFNHTLKCVHCVCVCVFLLEGIQSDCEGAGGKYEILSWTSFPTPAVWLTQSQALLLLQSNQTFWQIHFKSKTIQTKEKHKQIWTSFPVQLVWVAQWQPPPLSQWPGSRQLCKRIILQRAVVSSPTDGAIGAVEQLFVQASNSANFFFCWSDFAHLFLLMRFLLILSVHEIFCSFLFLPRRLLLIFSAEEMFAH